MNWTITYWLVAAAGAAVAALLFVRVKAVVREAARRVASRCALAAFAVFAAVCTAEAQKQKRGVDAPAGGVMAKRAAMPMRAAAGAEKKSGTTRGGIAYETPHVVSEQDVARMWSVESVATNETFGYSGGCANVVEETDWSARGGCEMDCAVEFGGGFAFPLGTNLLTRVRALSGGTVCAFAPPQSRQEICAARRYAHFVPGSSRFWHADADSGAKLLTWEGISDSRDGTDPYSVQLELRASGDFVMRRGLVETVCRRINPDDWDGDGLANELDPEPTTRREELYFGTCTNWYNAVCGRVLQAGCDDDGEVAITWREGVNANAYYWLEFAVGGAEATATVRVTCDGPSNLGDMIVIARTNEVCRVPMLVGAQYRVVSTAPFTSFVPSDFRARFDYVPNMWGPEGYGMQGSFPLRFDLTPPGDGGSHYGFSTWPINIGATISEIWNSCCLCAADEGGLSWDCSPSCHCVVGHNVWGFATWEGYNGRFGKYIGCPCLAKAYGDVSLRLDMPHVLFTNDDGGAEDSDIVVLTAGVAETNETNLEGMEIGSAWLDLADDFGVNVWTSSDRAERVTFPVVWNLSDHATTNLYVEGASIRPPGSARFTLDWIGKDGSILGSTNAEFAIYCPIANVINNYLYDNGNLCNPCAIVTGKNACFEIEFGEGIEPSPEEIVWSIAEGDARFVNDQNHGKRVRVESDTPDQHVKLRVQIGDCRSRPIEMNAFTVDPLQVKLTIWIVGNSRGTYYATDEASVINMVNGVNKIYEQIGVSFYIDSISRTNRTEWIELSRDQYSSMRRQLTSLTRDSGGLEIYFTTSLGKRAVADENCMGIVASRNSTVRTLAHEIGHAFGCMDIYHVQKRNHAVQLQDRRVCEDHCAIDWNNGTGGRYYLTGLTQDLLIKRLLMCGFAYLTAKDMSCGSVYGLLEDNTEGNVDIGFFTHGTRRALRLHR